MFFYGTLCHAPLLELVLGRGFDQINTRPATLENHAVYWAKDQAFPMIYAEENTVAEGLLVCDLSQDDLDRLNFYEGGFAYELRPVEVAVDGRVFAAQVYFPDETLWEKGARWSLEDWAATWSRMTLRAAQEVMVRRGHVSAQEIVHLLPFFRARAWAQELAETPAPQTLRNPMSSQDIDIVEDRPGFNGFFQVKAFQVSHKKFDGTQSPALPRETFMSFDVALLLPYDPVTDQVLLIEQVRFGTFNRGDPAPWVLEPIAGLVDAGEAPRDAAIRESAEEAHLNLTQLIDMPKVYASPGYSTEFFHCYLGICDLGGRGQGQGGLASENEDIRNHVISFHHAMDLVDSGEVNVAPLAMMLLWLCRKRESLRAQL
ncbi:gamma-glutamylcyclotransferase [uncultured Pelagimonas sp.]|uniref:gamma-glutamylcyclotransferase n=1 Tax=uncultured Pelagimonas sp. TaxID=1618102 RepID=UPI00262BE463|nr:gamma-glutamylcyclotransferase [uncultured Pelagimonas sp.]